LVFSASASAQNQECSESGGCEDENGLLQVRSRPSSEVLGSGLLANTSVSIGDLKFDCHWTPQTCNTPQRHWSKNVVMVHGFPESKEIYNGLMSQLGEAGYCGVACDMRGYSPGASPDKQSDYLYTKLRGDVFGIAHKSGFARFHLIGHDHGAMLGWFATTDKVKRNRILSFTALSVPHVDAFSAGLYGPEANLQQQGKSQYFTMFVLPNSASLHHNLLFNAKGQAFPSPEDFQKALWWYNGISDEGIVAMPPLMNVTSLIDAGVPRMVPLRKAFGGEPNSGWAASNPIGDVYTPSLFVCGASDPYILCNQPFSLKTRNYVKKGYQYLEVDCDHSLLACQSATQTQKVIDGIIEHVKRNSWCWWK